MDHSEMFLATVLNYVTASAVVIVHVAALVVALAVVRPRHREAAAWIATGAGMMLFADVAWHVAMRLLSGLGTMHIAVAYAMVGAGGAVWGAAAWGVLLFGVVRLCREPVPQPRP